MGNCSNLCSRVIIPYSDIPVNSNSSLHKNSSSKTISKYNNPTSIKKIILIQSWTKGFLMRLKKLNKASKYTTKTKIKSGLNSSSNNFTKTKSLKKTTTDDNPDHKKKSTKNLELGQFLKDIMRKVFVPWISMKYI